MAKKKTIENNESQSDASCRQDKHKLRSLSEGLEREQKHIFIQANFSRINENDKYISQSTMNWTFGLHKKS